MKKATGTPPTLYRARLRFRLIKKLNIAATSHIVSVDDVAVELSAQTPETNICDSEWLVFNARGLPSEADARAFGNKLRAALELSSVCARVGIDAGRDLPTSGLAAHVKQKVRETTGELIRDNVHGLDVFPDDPSVRIFSMSGTASVLAPPDPFLIDLSSWHALGTNITARGKDIILLLNTALMQTSPVAQIVFAVSAVEMLGQEETWTEGQQQLLEHFAIHAEQSDALPQTERAEIADAIRRSHRMGLRQGVLRLLDRLELRHLKKDWDRLYGERSTLVHGLAPQPGADYGNLAFRTLGLCGRVLLTALGREVPSVRRHIDRYYGDW